MKSFAAVSEGVVQDVTVNEGDWTPSPRDGVPYIECPEFVQVGDTTPDGGMTWYRDGVLLVDPGHDIPVADVLKRMTDQELATWLSLAFPGCNLPLAVPLVRVLAQTALHSLDPRVVAALPGFTAMFGAARVKELLAP